MGAVDRPVNFFADSALVFGLPGTDIKYNFTLALGTVIVQGLALLSVGVLFHPRAHAKHPPGYV